jgi:hypothetical protein
VLKEKLTRLSNARHLRVPAENGNELFEQTNGQTKLQGRTDDCAHPSTALLRSEVSLGPWYDCSMPAIKTEQFYVKLFECGTKCANGFKSYSLDIIMVAREKVLVLEGRGGSRDVLAGQFHSSYIKKSKKCGLS